MRQLHYRLVVALLMLSSVNACKDKQHNGCSTPEECAKDSKDECLVDEQCQALPAYGPDAICDHGHCSNMTTHPCVGDEHNPDGSCVTPATCETYGCANEHRECSDYPAAHCMGCLAGFVDHGGVCVAALTCADHPCAPDLCSEDAEHRTDRVCSPAALGCAAGSVKHEYIPDKCVTCVPECTAMLGSSGETVDRAISGTTCACETVDGYFLSMGEGGGTVSLEPCDGDGDGWVRDAVLGLPKFAELGYDPLYYTELYRNNRCVIRYITQMELQSEDGLIVGTVTLPTPIPMVESTRNDDDSVLGSISQNDQDPEYLPTYGIGGRQLRASEINGLTKVCVSPKADANDNGVADIDERHEDSTADYRNAFHNDVALALKDFTYFMEMNEGWFVQAGGVHAWVAGGNYVEGKFIIRERSRAGSLEAKATGALAVTPYDKNVPDVAAAEFETGGNNQWRTCERFQDSAYASRKASRLPLYGLDFARFSASSVDFDKTNSVAAPAGMGHHSQFKCLLVDDTPRQNPPAYVVESSDANLKYSGSECIAAEGSVAVVHDGQTVTIPQLECSKKEFVAQARVGWGVVNFATGLYENGCADESLYFKARCPGFDPENTDITRSDADRSNFGHLLCGCGISYGGLECNRGCAADQLFVEPGYEEKLVPASSRLYWMCGSFSGGATIDDAPSVDGYTLRGDFSRPFIGDDELSGNDGWMLFGRSTIDF